MYQIQADLQKDDKRTVPLSRFISMGQGSDRLLQCSMPYGV